MFPCGATSPKFAPSPIRPSSLRIKRNCGLRRSTRVGAMTPRSKARALRVTDISGAWASSAPSASMSRTSRTRRSSVRRQPPHARTVSANVTRYAPSRATNASSKYGVRKPSDTGPVVINHSAPAEMTIRPAVSAASSRTRNVRARFNPPRLPAPAPLLSMGGAESQGFRSRGSMKAFPAIGSRRGRVPRSQHPAPPSRGSCSGTPHTRGAWRTGGGPGGSCHRRRGQ